MGFSVTKKSPVLIPPSEPTPSGRLPFSHADPSPRSHLFLEMILVFRHGKEAAKMLRNALGKALVTYYPVAGRLLMVSDTEDDYESVECSGDGAWFVEANADCVMDDDVVECVDGQREMFLPRAPPDTDEMTVPLMMQVTEFKCGSFTIGTIWSHTMFDGVGFGQFMLAISDLALGLPRPNITPIWSRQDLRWPHIIRPTPPSQPKNPYHPLTLDLHLKTINNLKTNFLIETGKMCTAFEIVTAVLWQSRIRSLIVNNETESLIISTNVRKQLGLDDGYYGNAVFSTVVTLTSERIRNASVNDIVELIKDAKQEVSGRLTRFLEGGYGAGGRNTLGNVTIVTDFRRIGIYDADFGWGRTWGVVAGFRGGVSASAHCIVLEPPGSRGGVRLVTNCVAKERVEAFRDEMKNVVPSYLL